MRSSAFIDSKIGRNKSLAPKSSENRYFRSAPELAAGSSVGCLWIRFF
jgi:hypothetical protein